MESFTFPPIGSRARARVNLAALEIIKRNPEHLTEQELQILQHYSGWGDTTAYNYAFPELEKLVTREELESISASRVNAHYTSPAVIDAMWQVLCKLPQISQTGQPLKILEPALGSGAFIHHMPPALRQRSAITAVELEPVTAQIAQRTLQDVTIHACGLQEAPLKNSSYDLLISNVPFGNYGVYDPAYRGRKELTASIHNYFFVKALDLCKPGGIVAFITSRYTLDSKSDTIRKYIASRATLLGAVRLPSSAFYFCAGTEVVTDIIFLQVGIPDPNPDLWLNTIERKLPNYIEWVETNTYYTHNPSHLLGRESLARGQFSQYDYTLDGDEETLQNDIPQRLGLLAANPSKIALSAVDSTSVRPNKESPTFDKMWGRGIDDALAPRFAGLRNVYEAAKHVLEAQRSTDEQEIAQAMAQLNTVYDGFVASFGRLRSKDNNEVLSKHPAGPFLFALEVYESGLFVRKADIFTKRIMRSGINTGNAATVMDAVSICYNTTGDFYIDRVAGLWGRSVEDTIAALGDFLYLDPQTDQYVIAEAYLSGDVKTKLEIAQRYALTDPTYNRNVEALAKVQPAPLFPEEIFGRLGSAWIPGEDIAAFISHLLDGGQYRVRHLDSPIDMWTIEVFRFPDWERNNDTYGTKDRSALELIEAALNGKLPVVTRQGEKLIVETQAAQDKQNIIKVEFQKWLWADQDRAMRLEKIYNERFNRSVSRKFDGSHLSLPDLATGFTPTPAQLDAVWRGIQTKSFEPAYAVGAGKTAIMIIAAYELKRLGLVRKSLIAVPNSLVGQWRNEIAKLYPMANVLVPMDDDFSPAKRKEFIARIATGEWDMCVIAHSHLKLLPVSDRTNTIMIQEQIAQLRDFMDREGLKSAKNRNNRVSKEAEKALQRLKTRLKRLNDMKKDDTASMTFEELGCDAFFVDEFHLYKNLFFFTRRDRITGLPASNSERAWDMYVKVNWLRQQGGRFIAATATPLCNSIAEVYTLLRYLVPSALEAAGLTSFDAWADTFGDTVANLEMTATGKFKTVLSFSEFKNIPELVQMLAPVLDVRTPDMLNLPRPGLFGGRNTIIAVPMSPILKAYIETLSERAEAMKRGVDPKKDNMLKLTSDARKASLDMRLIDPALPDDPMNKVNMAVNNVYQIWQASRARLGAQLVFCDLGTPKRMVEYTEAGDTVEIDDDDTEVKPSDLNIAAINSDVYNDIKAKLVMAGIPASQIAFVHEANSKDRRAELFERVNDGRVRVLIGSTGKMGVGMNAQRRLVALHHLDAPWRPDEVEQREGRILRQGNINDTVAIFTYVTEGSFDGVLWQTLERKARSIAAFLTGNTSGGRSVSELGPNVLSYAEVKSIATGNPLLMTRVSVETERDRLQRLRQAHQRSRQDYQIEFDGLPANINRLQDELDLLTQAQKQLTSEPFTLQGKTYKDAVEVGKAIETLLKEIEQTARNESPALRWASTNAVGAIRGLEISFRVFTQTPANFTFVLSHPCGWRSQPIECTKTGTGTYNRILGESLSIPNEIAKAEIKLDTLRKRKETLPNMIYAPFAYEAELEAVKAELISIDLRLAATATATDTTDEADLLAAIVAKVTVVCDYIREMCEGRKATDPIPSATAPPIIVESTAVVIEPQAAVQAEVQAAVAQIHQVFATGNPKAITPKAQDANKPKDICKSSLPAEVQIPIDPPRIAAPTTNSGDPLPTPAQVSVAAIMIEATPKVSGIFNGKIIYYEGDDCPWCNTRGKSSEAKGIDMRGRHQFKSCTHNVMPHCVLKR